MSELVIDVISDAVCPWCFVGKRRLEAARKRDGGKDVSVHWRPYQLDPSIPAGGLQRRPYMRAKFRDEVRLAEAHSRLTALGAEVGISFDFEAITRAPNTLDSHRVIRWAGAAGVQDAIVERLFRDYFERGRDIGDIEVLVEAARDCGMDGGLTRSLLAGDGDLDEVRAEIEHAQRLGVSGVPYFVFASKLAVSGAQSIDVLARAMGEARSGGGKTEVA
jgi:predicted DsbA family dithiol-disulfide isomerase